MDQQQLCNQEAEEAVVGAILLDNELIKECTLGQEHFYSWKLRRLYSAMRRIDEKGKPIDPITILDEMGIENLLPLGGIEYLTELFSIVPTTANFSFYEKLVKEAFQKRKTIAEAGKIIQNVKGNDISQTLSNGISALMAIEDEQMDDDQGDILSCLADLYLECEKDQDDIVGIASGFTTLDRLTGGFQESDLVIIGARPSMGKTAFALNIALNAAEYDVSMIFSLETPKRQLMKRLVGCVGNINSVKMRNPKKQFEEEDWQHLTETVGKLSITNLRMFDKAGMDVPYIWSNVRKLRKEFGNRKRMLVVIDYLQLIESSSKNHQNRQAEISEISRALKTMARELNVVVVALSQLSRGVESRQDKRPILSDLRESGQIEQDADLIALLYRDDYYSGGSSQNDRIEVILAKNRNGPTGTVELGFKKEYGRFIDLEWSAWSA